MKNRLLTLALGLFCLQGLTAQEAAEATAEKAAETVVTVASKYNEALAELKAKNYANASGLFDETLAMADSTEDSKIIKLASSNSAISKYYLGNALLKEGKTDEAMAAYEGGAAHNPKQYSNYYGVAKVYSKKKMPVETAQAVVKAYETAKAAGKEAAGLKYFKTAQNAITKAYSAKNYAVVTEAGQVILDAGQDDADVRYYMAKSLIKEGDASAAVEHADKAAELGGTEKEGKFIYVHAEALEAAGQKAAAAAKYLAVPPGKYKESADYKANALK